jgi:hypothetical protein
MLNLLGAFIFTLILVAVLYHRPSPARFESWLRTRGRTVQALILLLLVLIPIITFFNLTGELTLPLLLVAFPSLLLWSITFWIHEAGHVYWAFGGHTIAVLGGTLNETLCSLGVGLFLLWRRHIMCSAIFLTWFANNAIGMSRYIADARALELTFLESGAQHDWEYLLGNFGLLEWDLSLGRAVLVVGVICWIAAIGLYAGQMRIRHEHVS